MAIGFDAAADASGLSVSSLSWSHTCTGANRALFVGVGSHGTQNLTSSVTYNSDPLTEIWDAVGHPDDPEYHNSGHYMVAPDTGGAHTVQVTLAGTEDEVVGGSISLTGVDQTTPIGTHATATNRDNSPTVNVSSATGEMVVDNVIVRYNGTQPPAGANQTQRYAESPEVDIHGMGSTEAGAATVTMSWTQTATEFWVIGAVPFKPDTGGGDQGVTGAHISSGAALNAPTVIQNVTGATIAAGSTLGAPTLAHAVAGAHIASGVQLFAATVAPGAVEVTGATIAAGTSLGAPTLAHEVAGATIASGATLGAPTATCEVTTATIAAGTSLFAPTVALDTGDQAVSGAHIASGLSLNAPTAAYAVTGAHIASTVTLGAPTLAHAVTTATITSGSSLAAPALAHVVAAPTIASGLVLNAPALTYTQTVSGAHIASTVVLAAPTVANALVELNLRPPFGAAWTDPNLGANWTDPNLGASWTDPNHGAEWS